MNQWRLSGADYSATMSGAAMMKGKTMNAVTTHIYARRSWLLKTRYEWRAVHSNGHIVATSGGQGYETRRVCVQMAKKYAPADSRIVDEAGESL